MSEYLFLDKSAKPADEDLKSALADTYTLWEEIKSDTSNKYGKVTHEWKFYSAKTGWTLKNMLGKRNLFFFKPYKGYFELTFVFGDKAVALIEKSSISMKIVNDLLSAKKYMEGRGVTVSVSNQNDLKDIFMLTEIKVRN